MFYKQKYDFKTLESYLERDKNYILIDSLAIEGGKKTIFLAIISGRKDVVVVRLFPKIEVDKTEEGNRILSGLAKAADCDVF